MARPRVVTDLQIWMLETGRTDVSLAAELSTKLREPAYGAPRFSEINERTVARWRKGLALPRYPHIFALLAELSGGRVTANSFADARLRESAEGGELGGEEITRRLTEQLHELPTAIAVIVLADVAAAVLATSRRSGGGSLEEARRVFVHLLDSRLKGHQ